MVVGVVAASPLIGAPASAATASEVPTRRAHVDTLLQSRLHDARLGHDVAMIVIDAATGAIVSSHAANRPMQAASNMKIVTATNALATMGPDTRFHTRVLAGATPRDMILQGAGDALLSRSNIEDLAVRTAARVRRGASVVVHVDGNLFARPSRAAGWVSGYLGSSVGLTQALALRGDRSDHPSRTAVEVFTARLRSLGIHARVGANADAAPDAAVLARTRGHTVSDAIAVMLRESDSGIAEVLFRQVAIASGRPPTWRGCRRAAMDSLRALGVDPAGMILIDGSGLSRDDRVTPRFLADVLRLTRVTERARFAAMFRASAMPTAGRTGTLTRAYGRYSSGPSRCAAGYVQAKTGTILSTIALSGIAKTLDGGRRIFSIIVNRRPLGYSALSTRQAVDGLAATITGCWR
jgi:D-alanyl-D-alanine carboxypeptidase/D-alanyl-D-alanine-endopeptidase (penicillin-binding protein 4)